MWNCFNLHCIICHEIQPVRSYFFKQLMKDNTGRLTPVGRSRSRTFDGMITGRVTPGPGRARSRSLNVDQQGQRGEIFKANFIVSFSSQKFPSIIWWAGIFVLFCARFAIGNKSIFIYKQKLIKVVTVAFGLMQ